MGEVRGKVPALLRMVVLVNAIAIAVADLFEPQNLNDVLLTEAEHDPARFEPEDSPAPSP